MSRAFTVIELLIVIAIIAVVASLAIPAYQRYSYKVKVEGDTHRIYSALKNLQLRAKMEKSPYCVKLLDPKTLYMENSTTCSSSGSVKSERLTLSVPFESNRSKLVVNKFGIFTTTGSIYASDGDGASIDCVKADTFRVCEGKWDGSSCNCVY